MQSFGSKAIAYAAVASQKGRKVGEKKRKEKDERRRKRLTFTPQQYYH